MNNTLVSRDYTPENTDGAMGAYGNTEMVYTWTLKETDTETYSVSVSGGEITTKLSASDPNFYEESDHTVT